MSGGAQARILIVDDDELVRDAVCAALQAQGHKVLTHGSGVAIDRVSELYRPDMAILDLGAIGAPGAALGRRLRSVSDVPMLFITSSDRLEDRLMGFKVGADDVVAKPFAVAELFARIQAILRRSGQLARTVLEVDDILVDERAHTVVRAGAHVEVTSIEFSLLVALMRHRGQVLSKTQLLSEVWGFEHYDVNLVEVHVSALRRKVERLGPRIIHTVRGVGYVLRPSGAVADIRRVQAV
jgi:two-component system, OmpR family, response regulator